LTGDQKDLDDALKAVEDAISMAILSDLDRRKLFGVLADQLGSKFKRTGALEALQTAIRKQSDALNSSLLDRITRASILNNMGNMLEWRFQRTGMLDDLDQAISALEDALKLAPFSQHNAAIRSNLGRSLAARYVRTKTS
jgi:tetratricopeptide (TPR) repeat protein